MLKFILLVTVLVLLLCQQTPHAKAYVYADPWRAAFMEMAAADPYLYQI